MTLITRMMSTTAGRTFAVAAAASAIALGATLTSAGAARADDASLMPDPVAYCETNPPFGMQAAVNGWQVQYDQLLGDSYTNNWRCEYWVSAVIPWLGEDGDEADFALPPITYSTPIDWNAMCNQQFPGAWAVWIPAPVTGAAGAPWGCQAPAGVTYDPAEDENGVHAVLSS
jgi:hypothetical protein